MPHAEVAEASQQRRVPGGLPAGLELQVRIPPEQRLEHHAALEPRQGGSHAEVDAVPEREMRLAGRGDVEGVGVVEDGCDRGWRLRSAA